MAEISTLGPRAAHDLVYAVGGMDADRILNFALRDGTTAEQVVAAVAAGVGGANQDIMARWGGFLSVVNMDHVKYRQGATASMTPISTEYDDDDPIYGEETGHMLPLRGYKDKLAWTAEWLRDAYMSQVDTDVQQVVERWWNRCEYDIILRMLTSTENGIGSGYDVPWAIGTGTNVNYIPPAFAGQSFASSHTHFKYANGTNSSTAKTLLDAMIVDLRHHGYRGTLQLLVSDTDVSTWSGMTGFVELTPQNMQIVAVPSSGEVRTINAVSDGVPGELFGYYKSKERGLVELYSYYRVPTKYCWLTKSFGVNNPQNGLAVRVHPTQPFGLRPVVMVDDTMHPRIKGIRLEANHGVGVKDRKNGVAGFFDSGAASYTNPTLT